MRRADIAMLRDSPMGRTTPNTTTAMEWLADVGWPTTTRVEGMVLQQSCPG